MREDMLAALVGRLRRQDSEQRLKRRFYFKSTSLDLYLQMVLSYGSFGGSSVGEARYASSQVRERDLDTWITAWQTVGESASRYAAEAEARGAGAGFPAPAEPDPRVQEFLDFEKAWLTGDWNAQRILMPLLAPLSLAVFCLAFWRRSVVWGLVILNLMAGGKLLWGVVAGDGTGWAMTAPAFAGLLLCDAALLWALRRLQARRKGQVRESAEASLNPSTDSSRSAAPISSTSRTPT
jgi:hypothetical protein